MSTRSRWIAVCVWAGCFLVSFAAAGEEGTAKVLKQLSRRLDVLEREQADSNQIEKLPPWLFGYTAIGWSSDQLDVAALDAARTDLREVLAGNDEARIKVLAIRWLAAGRSPEDVPFLEPLIDSDEPAGRFPSIHVTQRVQASYPVSWDPVTLGRAAIDGLSALTGTAFHRPADYRAWRSKNPDLANSSAYWRGILPQANERLRRSWLAALKKRDPELFLRVLLLRRARIELYGLDAGEVIGLAQKVLGKKGLLDLLRDRARWPEASDPERFAVFSKWMFDRADRWLTPTDAQAVISLWETVRYGDNHPYALVALALAAGRLAPDRERQIVSDTLSKIGYGQAPLLRRLAERHCREASRELRHWFFQPGASDLQARRLAILEGLAEAGRGAIGCLGSLVLDRRLNAEDQDFMAALVDTSRKLAPALTLPNRETMFAKGTGPWVRQKAVWRTITPKDERRARKARKSCLHRIRAWLRKSK